MAKCSSSKSCKGGENNVNITKESFIIMNVEFPGHNLSYKINASNDYGNDSKAFELQVFGNLKWLDTIS